MRPIVTDVIAYVQVCRSVCRPFTIVSPAKTAEPIEMPLGQLTRVGPKEPCVSWGCRSPHVKGQFGRGKWPSQEMPEHVPAAVDILKAIQQGTSTNIPHDFAGKGMIQRQ